MNRDDIIKMARDSGMELYGLGRDRTNFVFILERFAKAIEKNLSYDSIHTCHDECQRPSCIAVREAVKAEREVCAKVCENAISSIFEFHPEPVSQAGRNVCTNLAAAIRARGEK